MSEEVGADRNEEPARPVLCLSIAAPAYNEAFGIENTLSEWRGFLSRNEEIGRFEIVICDDGSTDGTGDILERLSAGAHEVRLVRFEKNRGAAAALTAAIKATRNAWVLLIDSDGQFPIHNLPRMIEALQRTGAIAAIGVRRKNDAAFARFGTWSSGALCNLIHGSKLRDFNSAFKLVPGPLLRELTLEARGMNYSTEITSRLLERGVTFAEVEIDHRSRESGRSKMAFVRGAIHRFLFVTYVAMRQLLIRAKVLVRPS
ncbi:MAG: glycosyltransferase family 2 protein [Caulobacteraceae bacterium]